MDFRENFVPIAQADLDVDIVYEREQQEAMGELARTDTSSTINCFEKKANWIATKS